MMNKEQKERRPLTKKAFEALLTRASQPFREKESQQGKKEPDSEARQTSESQSDDD